MLFVQFEINSTRDVWKFCQIGLAPAARTILAKYSNITRTINLKLYSQSHDYLQYTKLANIWKIISRTQVKKLARSFKERQ